MHVLDEHLRELLLAGEPVDLGNLGDLSEVSDTLRRLAAGPLAPLVAALLTGGAEVAHWPALVEAFAAGLQHQPSQLALVETCDDLMASPEILEVVGESLCDSLIPDAERIMSVPDVAATGLETSLRLALMGKATPYGVLAALTSVPADAPEGYYERIPRLVGIALDVWNDRPDAGYLVATLQRLNEKGVEDGPMELARHKLRAATQHADIKDVRDGLVEAAEAFAVAAEQHEVRDDAVGYAAVCRAVLAFHDGDAGALQTAASAARVVAEHRALLLRGMHVRPWSAPRRTAEFAWYSLAAQLEVAASELAGEEFMDSWAAVDALLGVYGHDRTLAPGGVSVSPLVSPRVTNDVARHAGMIRQLQRVVELDRDRSEPQLPPEAALLLAAARHTAGHEPSDRPDTEEPAPSEHLAGMVAPEALRALLREHPDSLPALDDLASILSVTYSGHLVHPTVGPLLERLLVELDTNPAFADTAVRAEFGPLVTATVCYLAHVADNRRAWTRPLEELEKVPLERVLQEDLYHFLCMVPMFATRVMLEPLNSATGRGDLSVQFDGGRRYYIETKREQSRVDRDHLNASYTGQAAEYQASNVPLSELVVLDLTDHSSGSRHLSDSAWVHHRDRAGVETMRSVVVAVVTGNRLAPSATH